MKILLFLANLVLSDIQISNARYHVKINGIYKKDLTYLEENTGLERIGGSKRDGLATTEK